MSATILALGIMVFLSHFLSLSFKRTNIPDVLVLMLVGLVLGPVLGLINASDFGKTGHVIATIALVVILFESGTSLSLETMGRSLATTCKLSLGCFFLTALIVTLFASILLGLPTSSALLLGIILGGTSSAVVIPMVNSLRMDNKTGTVLILESAMTDVISIVGVVAMLRILTEGDVEAGKLIGGVIASLTFATVIGVLGGVGWLMIIGKVRDFPNTISATLAYAFIVYGTAEILGFSGAIAAMALGVTLTNYEKMGLRRLRALNKSLEPLTSEDLAFYREAVFLLKTYFFTYLGISIRFNSLYLVLVATGIVITVFLARMALSRFVFSGNEYGFRDSALASLLAPKGLAAAVLAAVPMQYGIAGAEQIRDSAYMVVVISILMCAVLVAAIHIPFLQAPFGSILGKRQDDPAT